jgi:hypothetical protein
MEAIMNLVWAFLNSPIGITLVVSAVGSLVAAVYAKKPLWKKYEGVLVSAVKMAEKAVPDDSENTSIARLDAALKYAVTIIEAMGKKVTDKEESDLESGLSIVHDMVEANGTLSPAKE